jgi:hypothetical protein
MAMLALTNGRSRKYASGFSRHLPPEVPMRVITRMTIVVVVAAQASVAVSTVQAQAGKPAASGAGGTSACSVLTPEEIVRITKRANPLNLKPEEDAVGTTTTECHFLSLDLQLVRGETHESFEATRKQQVKYGYKVEPVSGVGEEAFSWERPGRAERLVAIVFRVGQTRFGIQDMVPTDSMAAVKPSLVALAKAAAAKLK